MSKLGKILLIIAALGGLASAVAGGLIIEKRGEDKVSLNNANDTIASDKKVVAQQKVEISKAKDATDEANTKLTKANSDLADLNNQLTTAKKLADDANAAVKSANDKAQTASDELDKIKAGMKGRSPEEYMADVAKAQQDLVAAQSEKKVLGDQLAASDEKVKQLMIDINNIGKKLEPPGVSGKVTFVDNTWNFVVLDVGLDAGVVPNGELIVYRGKTFLGKLRVTRSDPKDSVAEILPDVKGNIQVGDAVLN